MFKPDFTYTLQDIKGLNTNDCEEKIMYIRYLLLQNIEANVKEAYEIYKGYLELRMQELRKASQFIY